MEAERAERRPHPYPTPPLREEESRALIHTIPHELSCLHTNAPSPSIAPLILTLTKIFAQSSVPHPLDLARPPGMLCSTKSGGCTKNFGSVNING